MEVRCDVLVVGGGLGGVAAAWAAARNGRAVVLTEPTAWLGGQLTSQAVPCDEHPWIEQFGATATYRALRNGIRGYYRAWYPLTAAARSLRHLNPGAGTVSAVCAEPRVGVAVIDALLAADRASGRLDVRHHHRPVAVETDGDRVAAVRFADAGGDDVVVSAPYVLDATETGELLPLAGVEHVTGFESRADTGEPHAPAQAQPVNIQAASVCFALDHRAGEDHTIDRPEGYARFRELRLPGWPGPLLDFTAVHPHTGEPRTHTFTPNPDHDPAGPPPDPREADLAEDLWRFRRILARRLFVPGAFDSDITLVNWPMIDYTGGPVYQVEGVDEATAAHHERQARALSRSALHWLQTEAPRPDGGTGWPGLRLRGDVVGTADGLAQHPYIRESRRIRGLARVTETDVSVEVRGEAGPTRYADSVGIGAYRIDLHPTTGGDAYLDVPAWPFQIPLGALVPVRVRNLLPAAKNIATTHITNGCYRLHPVEWNVGEAAGLLAAHCLATGAEPAQVRADPRRLGDLQRLLTREGVELAWPEVRGY